MNSPLADLNRLTLESADKIVADAIQMMEEAAKGGYKAAIVWECRPHVDYDPSFFRSWGLNMGFGSFRFTDGAAKHAFEKLKSLGYRPTVTTDSEKYINGVDMFGNPKEDYRWVHRIMVQW